MIDFDQLLAHLGTTEAWLEAGGLFLVLLASYGLTRWQGQRASEDSVLFGRSPLSGLMFPLLALAGAYACEVAWASHHSKVSVFKFAIPVLVSLAIIRLLARVLRAVFPRSQLALKVERTVSWLAWAGAVLWIVGFLPWMLTELESIRISFGKTKLDLRTLIEGAILTVLIVFLFLNSWRSTVITGVALPISVLASFIAFYFLENILHYHSHQHIEHHHPMGLVAFLVGVSKASDWGWTDARTLGVADVLRLCADITRAQSLLAGIAGHGGPSVEILAPVTGETIGQYGYEVTGPFAALLTKVPESGSTRVANWREAIGLFMAPLTPEQCRVWFVLAVADHDSPDEVLQQFQHTIFTQDQPVLESQQPKTLPLDLRAELHTVVDKMSSSYRRYLQRSGITFGVC